MEEKEFNKIIITDTLSEIASEKLDGYLAHGLCLDISRQLRNRDLTFVQIADMFNFSSPAYFSRYVQNNLGMNPSDYRD